MNTALAKNKTDMSLHDYKKDVVHAIASAMENGDERVRCFGAKALGVINRGLSLFTDEAEQSRRMGTVPICETLIKYLNDPDPDVRCDAAMALGEIGEESAVQHLIKALDDEDCMVKISAVDALSKIGSPIAAKPLIYAAASTDPLISMLGDISWDYRWDIREKGISALGMIKDSQAVDALIGFLKDEDTEIIRAAIFKSLIRQGDKRGVEVAADYLKDKDVSVRRKASAAFTHADNPQVLEHLSDAVIDEDSLVKVNVIKTIGKLGAEKDIVPLILLLKDEDEEVRIESIKAIAKIMGNRGVKYISLLLNDKSSVVKKTAVELLGEKAGHDCIEPLIKILDSADDDLCSEIITALVGFEPAPAGFKQGYERVKDAIIGIIMDKNRSLFVRNKALRMLKINEDRKGLDSVLEIIKDAGADKSLKETAFECLRNADEKTAADAVSELLGCADVNIKVSIVKTFKKFKDIESEKILLDFLNDENDALKKQSAISLAYRGNDAGFEIIKEIIKNGKSNYAEEICDVVKNIKNEKAVNLLMDCMESEDPFLRYTAVKSVGSAGRREAVNLLIRLLDDENKDVRREAVAALGKIGNESVLPLLVSRLYDYERFNDMRRDIAIACKNINQDETVKTILDTLNDESRKDDHWTAIEALSTIYGEKNRDAYA